MRPKKFEAGPLSMDNGRGFSAQTFVSGRGLATCSKTQTGNIPLSIALENLTRGFATEDSNPPLVTWPDHGP
jgi:hypothetical protein